MTKNFKSSLILLALASNLLFALPMMADTKSAPTSTMTDQNMSGHSSSEAAHGESQATEITVAKDEEFEVSVQTDPEKPTPNKPVTIMISVKNQSTQEPVLDASVNVSMMLMDSGSHSNMSGMSMDSDTTIKGQATLDNMEPGMYAVTLTPTKQGEWSQDIQISSPTHGETTLTVPLTVSKTGPNWLLIGSVGGIVVLAGIIAQFLKRKQSTVKEVQ
ncbi:hypothetical protein [Desulfosporosinus hippei]|uniref:YtkA-like n=1 Tax=Desulfosporosinus hippei DSM 8344 TaxID=1121419 RepID=A0A1G7TAP8_9FIRM|nr:hypothetical protein [Desulfosporosinus hippei]SDG32437.1 hypothetical protein SAMN05443529_102165 [Desulfosporosinus hippei DSM 8344]